MKVKMEPTAKVDIFYSSNLRRLPQTPRPLSQRLNITLSINTIKKEDKHLQDLNRSQVPDVEHKSSLNRVRSETSGLARCKK